MTINFRTKILAITFYCLLSPFVFSAGWFDGLPDQALSWIYENAAATESQHNARRTVIGNIEIVISFFDGTAGYYSTQLEDQGGWSNSFEQVPVWEPDWVEVKVWNEGTPGYYWVKITDLDKASSKYISGVWKKFSSKDEIIKEVKSAESPEAKASRLDFERWLLKLERVNFLRFKAFSTGVDGENKAPMLSSETPVATADKTAIRIVDQLITMRRNGNASASNENSSSDSEHKSLFSGIITYEDFKYNDIEGEAAEVLSEIQYSSDSWEYGCFIPVTYVDVNFSNWSKLGLTGYLKKNVEYDSFNFSGGFYLSAEQTWMDDDYVDDSIAFGGGPLISIAFNLGDLLISLGTNYLYMDNSEFDEVEIVTSALSIFYPVNTSLGMNLYLYSTENLDSDNDYLTLGGSASYLLSEVFGLVLGVNTVEKLDDYDSVSLHLGGNWRF